MIELKANNLTITAGAIVMMNKATLNINCCKDLKLKQDKHLNHLVSLSVYK
jgi:hypothetical protein